MDLVRSGGFGFAGFGGRTGADAVERGEGLLHHLAHVVVTIGGESTDESHILRRIGQSLVTKVQLRIFWTRNRIVRISVGPRELLDDRRARILLAGQVLELGDSRVLVLV